MSTDQQTVTVKITRAKLYPQVARPGPAWLWHYSWTASDGSHLVDYTCPDGTVRTGVNIGSYGTGLASLRDMLRRKYGRGVTIVEAWRL